MGNKGYKASANWTKIWRKKYRKDQKSGGWAKWIKSKLKYIRS